MIKLTSIRIVLFFCAALAMPGASCAQGGPCLLGVGNCPQVTTTPNPQNNVDPGNHTVHITDARAAEIVDARNNNARYLLVLQRYYDSSVGLWCEERAWVGGTFAGDASQVVVGVGPAVKVCLDPNRPGWTAEQVNQVERAIDSWVDAIYQWEQYEARMANYLNQQQNNPQGAQYAQNELQRARAWTQYYRGNINNYRNAVNQFAPPSN